MLDKGWRSGEYTGMLTHLSLYQFRKYPELSLDFPEGTRLVAFVGPNTAGKTNILEAMYFLCLLKSFRTHTPQEMMLWDEHVLRVEGRFEDGTELAVGIASRPKRERKYTINGGDVPVDAYVGTKTVVFFSPDDINMLLQSPTNRRRYLDIILCQTDKRYLRAFATYGKVLKQRNALLRACQQTPEAMTQLEYWEQELVHHGIFLMQARMKLTQAIAAMLPDYYAAIAGKPAEVTVEYVASMPIEADEAAQLELLRSQRDRDILLGATTKGPHRDDLVFLHNGRAVESFASRGDTRSFVLALKLGELDYIQKTTSVPPLLLMDDVFSELDRDRQQRLLENLPLHVQTFITTTHLPEQLDATDFPVTVFEVGMDGGIAHVS